MLNELNKALRRLLEMELPELVPAGRAEADKDIQTSISFDPPYEQDVKGSAGLDLFLYDIREDRELRNNEWSVERTGKTARLRPPPVRVACSYVITGRGPDIDEQHKWLGRAMRVLLRYPTLPREVLGELASQELPPPTAALQPGHIQSLGEFWQALGGKPRAALHYTVSICVDPEEEFAVPAVLQSVAGIERQEHDGEPVAVPGERLKPETAGGV